MYFVLPLMNDYFLLKTPITFCKSEVQSAVQTNECVFIIKGSGGIADAIVRMYEAVKSDDDNVRAAVQKDLGNVEYLRKHVQTITNLCFAAERKRNLRIVDYTRGSISSSCAQMLLKQSIIVQVGRGVCNTMDGRGFADSWRQYLEQLVRDRELRFLKDVLSAVFEDLTANAEVPM